MQNPPGFPAMPLATLCCKLAGVRLIVDWHNYTHSLLLLPAQEEIAKVQPKAETLRVKQLQDGDAEDFSRWLVCRAAAAGAAAAQKKAHAAVTAAASAMGAARQALKRATRLAAAAAEFQIARLSAKAGAATEASEGKLWAVALRLAAFSAMQISVRKKRPAVLLTSSSYTADEDLLLLLRALQLVVASADLGICLHRSSSSSDLPMKAQDMKGAGLPILALSFAALHEILPEWQQFSTAEDLASMLACLLRGFPEGLDANTVIPYVSCSSSSNASDAEDGLGNQPQTQAQTALGDAANSGSLLFDLRVLAERARGSGSGSTNEVSMDARDYTSFPEEWRRVALPMLQRLLY
ncbi:hypothetical protein cyc_05827 [Cyclospora cayetanensis]|uniref:Uncharacterized protein n=1 Tax=Cyclospora cayetanensis TaxID=88456 RepID=A0A1D3CZ58_9EIME|nr:hypothetical protein cyc_05827 [Cyclospora cayetanensis]